MDVVIDANIIYNDPRLTRLHFRVVRLHARHGDFTLVFPEVVVRECVAKFGERAADAYASLGKPADELSKLGIPLAIPSSDEQRAQQQGYDEYLRGACQEEGCEIEPLPEISHDHLLDRAVAKSKPFNVKGGGYRDALIWETVAERARWETVAFITNNHSDFGDEDDHSRVAPELARDLGERGADPQRVTIYPDLGGFIAEHVPRASTAHRLLADRIQEEDVFRSDLLQQLSLAARDYRPAGEAWTLALPADSTGAQITHFEADEVSVSDVYELEHGALGVDLSVQGEADIDIFVPKWAAWAEDADIEILASDWNEWFAWANAHRRLVIDVAASYDEEESDFTDVEIDDAREASVDR